MLAQSSVSPSLLLWLLASAGVLVLVVWLYLWLFHHRFWTTRILPLANGNSAAPTSATCSAAAASKKNKAAQPYSITQPQAAAQQRSTSQQHANTPAVLVVIPARNEAEVIARTVADVLSQDYAGALHLVVVNDNSQDQTATLAEQSAAATLATLSQQKAVQRRFSVINGSPLPAGWSGKLWAVEQGIRHGLNGAYAEQAPKNGLGCESDTAQNAASATRANTGETAQFVWLTDADISHSPQVLSELITRARCDNRALVSRMALLCTDTAAERWTIPAFVYFFQMLYPFAAIANERSGIHGAAGGCIVLERAYLEKIGGIGSLRGALIDDCTLADHVARAGGRLWLELTKSSLSQRGYGGAQGVSNMIARTAYTQLHYSPLRLVGTVFGLIFTFFCPLLLLPLAAIALLIGAGQQEPHASASVASHAAAAIADSTTAVADGVTTLLPAILAIGCPLLAAAIMFGTFIPMLRFYGRSPLRALGLPVIASFYLSATIKSAVRHYRGKTGNWKGRVYQNG